MLFDNNCKVYLFGTGEITEKVIIFLRQLNIEPAGVICDYNFSMQWNEWTLLQRADVIYKKKDLIISCAMSNPLFMLESLHKDGFNNVKSFYEIGRNYPLLLKEISYFTNMIEDIKVNESKYHELSQIFEDDKSRRLLDELIKHRAEFSFDISSIENSTEGSKQYFDDFLQLTNDEVFVDGGSFNGDTTKQFIDLTHQEYKHIYLFEPNAEMLNKAKSLLISDQNITYFSELLYSKICKLTFNNSLGAGSKIVHDDNTPSYLATTIDETTKNIPPTFIKLDVEGAELDVIKGAEKTIKKYKPKLAVCVYHEQDHFWKVPQLIMTMRNDYKIYLRHYSNGIFETVMYFI